MDFDLPKDVKAGLDAAIEARTADAIDIAIKVMAYIQKQSGVRGLMSVQEGSGIRITALVDAEGKSYVPYAYVDSAGGIIRDEAVSQAYRHDPIKINEGKE